MCGERPLHGRAGWMCGLWGLAPAGKSDGARPCRSVGSGDPSIGLWTTPRCPRRRSRAATGSARDCRRAGPGRRLARLSAPGWARPSRRDRGVAGHPSPGIEEAMREEDFPAQQPQEEEEARVPSADAQPRRAGGAQAPPAQGTRPPVGLTRRVSGRAEFRSLAGARRLRSGVLSLASCPTSTPGQPRVAFAVPRSVGGAVDRNRVRRRLREAVRSQAALMLPGTAYLIGARRGAAETTYREIEATLRELVLRSSEGRT